MFGIVHTSESHFIKTDLSQLINGLPPKYCFGWFASLKSTSPNFPESKATSGLCHSTPHNKTRPACAQQWKRPVHPLTCRHRPAGREHPPSLNPFVDPPTTPASPGAVEKRVNIAVNHLVVPGYIDSPSYSLSDK